MLTSGAVMIATLAGTLKVRSLRRSGLWLVKLVPWTDILLGLLFGIADIAVVLYFPGETRPPDKSAVHVAENAVAAVSLFLQASK